jgi:exosortase A
MILAVAALVCLVYYSTLAGLARLWQTSEYRYGALVFPIAALLLWRSRHSLANVELKPWPPGLAVVAGLVLVWWLSSWIGVQVTEQLAAVLLIPAVATAVLGPALLRQGLFPLLFLAAAVPMGDGLTPYLMRFTAQFSTQLLRLTGVPVFRDGQIISLPGGTFEIADVCSGLNYLVSGTLVAVLFAYLTFRGPAKRTVFVALTALALVLGNALRAASVMFVASASHMKYFVGRDHVWFGWMLFGIIVIALFSAASRWADPAPAPVQRSVGADETRRRPSLLPLTLVLTLVLLAATAQRFQADLGTSWKLLLPAGALFLWLLYRRGTVQTTDIEGAAPLGAQNYRSFRALAVVGMAFALLVLGPIGARPGASIPTAPQVLRLAWPPECAAAGDWAGPWQPAMENADFVGSSSLRCNGQSVNVFLAGYERGGQGREVVDEANALLPKPLRYATPNVYRFEDGDGGPLEVNELQIRGPSGAALVWYWYEAGDKRALTDYGVTLLQAYGLLTWRGSGNSVYLLEAPLDGDLEGARRQLAKLAEVLPQAVRAERTNAAAGNLR